MHHHIRLERHQTTRAIILLGEKDTHAERDLEMSEVRLHSEALVGLLKRRAGSTNLSDAKLAVDFVKAMRRVYPEARIGPTATTYKWGSVQ